MSIEINRQRGNAVQLWSKQDLGFSDYMLIIIIIIITNYDLKYPSLWPSGIGVHLGRNRLRVRILAVSDTYPMFIESMITRVSSGYILAWYKNLCLKKINTNPRAG